MPLAFEKPRELDLQHYRATSLSPTSSHLETNTKRAPLPPAALPPPVHPALSGIFKRCLLQVERGRGPTWARLRQTDCCIEAWTSLFVVCVLALDLSG